jgi:hypothetical protein
VKAHRDAARLLIAGTGRTPVPPQEELARAAPVALAPLISRLGEGASEEARLWRTLAALDLARRAGFVPAPPERTAAASAAAPDRHGPPSPRAESLLRQMLGGFHPQLIAEWLRLAALNRRRLPHGLLPAVLDLGASQAGLRAAISAAADERGRWLAAQNPRWAYLQGGAEEIDDTARLRELFEKGTPEQRSAALRRWRELAPGDARAALEAGWKSEAPEARGPLLRLLATGLGAGDEALLEAALDDRRKEARLAAQELLVGLPGSALVARLREQLAALVTVESRFLLGKKLRVELPAELTKAMQRDGVGRAHATNMGEKAGWLADLVAAMPLSHWSALAGEPPAKAIELLAGSEHREALLHGLAAACLHAPAADPEWTRALLGRWVEDSELRGFFPNELPVAVAGLPAPEADTAVAVWVRASPRTWSSVEPVAIILADAAQRPWSRALSTLVVERLAGSRAALSEPYSALRGMAPAYAAALDPLGLAEYEAAWPAAAEDTPALTRMHDEFFAVARLRHALHTSFSGDANG